MSHCELDQPLSPGRAGVSALCSPFIPAELEDTELLLAAGWCSPPLTSCVCVCVCVCVSAVITHLLVAAALTHTHTLRWASARWGGGSGDLGVCLFSFWLIKLWASLKRCDVTAVHQLINRCKWVFSWWCRVLVTDGRLCVSAGVVRRHCGRKRSCCSSGEKWVSYDTDRWSSCCLIQFIDSVCP